MYWNNWNICVWCTEGWKCQILPMRNLASFSPYLLSKPDCFPSIVAVDREQRVSAEELVLSGASRNTRLWALPGGRAPQPGPRPLQPEGGLLQLPQEQRSVWERERHVLCCFFCFFSVSRRNICGFVTVDSSVSLDWYWGRAQTKHVAHTGMSTISPTARKLILSPAALCLCFTESIDLFFLHYTPPHHCFMAFIEQRQRISVNIHVNKSDPAYPSC